MDEILRREGISVSFQALTCRCTALAYPYHDGEPSDLRANVDPRLGTVSLNQVVEHLVARLDELGLANPIVIGHSMGGLIVQKLVSLKRASLAVAISPAPPKGNQDVDTFQTSQEYFRSNGVSSS